MQSHLELFFKSNFSSAFLYHYSRNWLATRLLTSYSIPIKGQGYQQPRKQQVRINCVDMADKGQDCNSLS